MDLESLSNLSSTACLIIMTIWAVTKGVPSLLEKFSVQINQQRLEFRTELAEHREQSRAIAESGHAAVNRLADAFKELKDELREERRHRQPGAPLP